MEFRLHVIIVFERLSDGKVIKHQVIRNPNDTISTSTLHSIHAIKTKRAKHPTGSDPYYHFLYFSREPLVSQEYCSCCLIYSHEWLKKFSHAKSSAPSSVKIRLRDVCESVDGGHGLLQSSHEKDRASTCRKQKKKKKTI